MRRKYLALIIVILFIITVFNSSIVAENDISSRIDRLTMTRDIIKANKEFKKLDDDVISNCTDTEDYSELLKFMGNGSKIVFDAHINTSGRGLYLAKHMRYIKWKQPFPFFKLLAPLLAPPLLNQWLFYIKLNNQTYKDYGGKGPNTTAYTLIEPRNGDPPIYINGSHSVLALVWQFPLINKVINLCRTFNRWIKGFTGENTSKFNITWPWSIYQYRFKHMYNWNIIWKLGPLYINPTYYEFVFMLMNWPFNVITSLLNFEYGSRIEGLAAFIIYNDSTDAP